MHKHPSLGVLSALASSLDMQSPIRSPIAIVGIAAELPSGSWDSKNLDYDSFCRFLLDQGEAYETIPPHRFNIQALKGKGVGQVFTDTGAFLKDIQFFDFVEFGISSKDARLMGLSTRKLIELTFLSLLDSGIDYRGKNVGCYMSGVAHDMFSVSGHDDAEARGSFAYGPAMVANRVSYHLDLRGPSIPIDTACSSSLHATHLAVQALRLGECEAAVVGGCQINHRFAEWLLYTQGGVLSPDGKCKPFDASANGFSRGEGAVVIVLKPLEQAIRANDKIYATILGTGINSSGSLAPVSAPVASAQEDTMIRAFSQTGRSPKDVDFIELHATGTAQGDPIEANWVGAMFKRDDDLMIGSVKGNLGHLEITAFLASLCKVCYVLKSGIIPPNVNLNILNPAIHWDEYNLKVPLQRTVLPRHGSGGQSLIAMTSSGIGGANGSCIVEGPPPVHHSSSSFWSADLMEIPTLLIAGGLSRRSTVAIADEIMRDISDSNRQRLARAYGRRSKSMTWRSFAVGLQGHLTRFSEPALSPRVSPPVVFLFSGQGPQHLNMGRDLFKSCIVFRNSILEMDDIYISVTGQSLIKTTGLFAPSEAVASLPSDYWPIAVTLPALTMLQIALVDTFSSVGVKPDIVVGHSAGETAVLYASGAASKQMAVELSIARDTAMYSLGVANGTMSALSCNSDIAAQIISEVLDELGADSLEIGCYNSRDAVTLSGAENHINRAVEKAQAAGIFARRLRTRTPVHSSMMEICFEEYTQLVREVFSRHSVVQPKVPTYSTNTGASFAQLFDAEYFWTGTRGPVRFTEAIDALLLDHPNAIFLEVGPHPVLSNYVSALAGPASINVCPMRRPRSGEKSVENLTFLEALGKLTVSGYKHLDVDTLCATSDDVHSEFPPYPFIPKECSYLAPTIEIKRQQQSRAGPLNYPQLQVNFKTHPGLAEHVIKGEPIMPAAGYVEMALELGARKLWDVEFISILPLSSERPMLVQVKSNGSLWSVHSTSTSEFSKMWPPQYNRLHAKGYMSLTEDSCDAEIAVPLDEIRFRIPQMDIKGLYDGFATFANYGPTYQRIISCHRGVDLLGRDEMLIEINGAGIDVPDVADYRIHPAILDSSLHLTVHPWITGNRDKSCYYLPSRIGTLTVHDPLINKPFPSIVYTHSILTKWSPDVLVYNLTMVDSGGIRLCTIQGLGVALHGDRTLSKVDRRYELDYQPTSLMVEPAPSSCYHTHNNNGSGVIVTNEHALFDDLVASPIILNYSRGNEMEIQKRLSGLDQMQVVSLWFIASAGLNGHALVGFTRSIRREYLLWTVHSVVFDGAWSSTQRNRAVTQLSTTELGADLELFIDEQGLISVPRIIPSPTPQRKAILCPERPWSYDGQTLKQISAPTVNDEEVLLDVQGVSEISGSLWTFVGRSKENDTLVTGIACGALSNIIPVHRGSLVEVPDRCISDKSGLAALSLIIGVLGIGMGSFSRRQEIEKRTVLVTGFDALIGENLIKFYGRFGLRIITLSSEPSSSELQAACAEKPNLIVSGYIEQDKIQMLKDASPRSGKIFLWNDAETGIAQILATDPWLIGDALRSALESGPVVSVPIIKPVDAIPKPLEAELATDLFIHTKTYLLIGGIGSLGLQIAFWMYKRGARDIIITSRSGRASITSRGDDYSLKLLTFMEGLSNLKLHVLAADATSSSAMISLVKGFEKPLGGCMLLSASLVDRTFAQQTPETFESPFLPKVTAFQVLEDVIPMDDLDFIIAFSSVSGMFGNAGQTNYASANTALSGLTRKYKNAVSLVCPAITDVGLVLGITMDSSYTTRIRHLVNWGMTCRELFGCLEDAIRKLQDGPIWTYIPDVDWKLVHENIGPSTMYNHLIIDDDSVVNSQTDDSPANLSAIICHVLEIDPEDLSPHVPLTAFGLDSLSAATLSFALRPLVKISQLQLMADLTMAELQDRIEADKGG